MRPPVRKSYNIKPRRLLTLLGFEQRQLALRQDKLRKTELTGVGHRTRSTVTATRPCFSAASRLNAAGVKSITTPCLRA